MILAIMEVPYSHKHVARRAVHMAVSGVNIVVVPRPNVNLRYRSDFLLAVATGKQPKLKVICPKTIKVWPFAPNHYFFTTEQFPIFAKNAYLIHGCQTHFYSLLPQNKSMLLFKNRQPVLYVKNSNLRS